MGSFTAVLLIDQPLTPLKVRPVLRTRLIMKNYEKLF